MSNRPWLRIAIGPCVLGLTLVAGCNSADEGTTTTASPTVSSPTPAPTTPTPGGAKTAPIDKGGPPSGAAGTAP